MSASRSPAGHVGDRAGRTLVIGLGNPILGDDGAGWRAAEAVQASAGSAVAVECHAGGGLSVMERLVGFDRAVVIDALQLHRGPVGSVTVCRLEDLAGPAGHLVSAHETDLPTALAVGRSVGLHLPREVWVVGIEAASVYDFGETLSRPVAEAIPEAARRTLELLEVASHDLS